MVPKGIKVAHSIGYIPEDWNLNAADQLCTKITKGTTPSKSEIVTEKIIPFLRVNNLSFSGSLKETSKVLFVSSNAHEGFLARSKAYPGDVLMNIVGPPLGKTALLDNTYPEYNMNQAIVFFRVIPNVIDVEFLLAYIGSSKAQQWLQARSKKTSGQQNLTIELCKELPIPTPPIFEQTKIAQILSTWDQAIATIEKLIENSKTQKKALMQQLLTGKKRFQEFVQSKETTPTKYGPIPKDWSLVALNEVAKDQVERAGENTHYPVLSCSKYVGFVDSLKYFKKKVYSDDTSNYKVVRRSCFGFPSNHIEEGSIGYQDVYDAGIVSPIYSVFKTKNQVHDSYLYKLLKTDHYRQIFKANTNASVDRRGSLRWKEFGKIRIPLPSVEEQKKIAATIITAELEISNLKDQLENLGNQKKALMQQLLTGKRRVKVNQ